MKKKLIEKFSQKIFNDQGLRISQERAKEIIDMLYEMDLDATALQQVIYRLESYVYDSMLADIIDSLDKTKLQELVRQIAVELLNPECAPEMDACKDKKYSDNMIAWLFSGFKEGKKFVAGDMVEVQIMREGKWNHPNYGEIEVTSDTLKQVKKNFDENKRGIELAVDENHEDDHKALGRFRELYIVADGLFAKIELTTLGAELLTQGAYKYFSPEIIIKKVDEESGEVVENLLVGGAFTNRPFFKLMDPIMANEVAGQLPNKNNGNDSNQYLFIFKNTGTMNKFMELVKEFGSAEKLTKENVDAITNAYNELPAEDKNNRLKATFESIVEKFEDPEADADKGDDADADPEADKGDEDKEEDKNEEGADKGDDADADPEADKGDEDPDKKIEANEKENVTIKASELDQLKADQKALAKMVAEKRKEGIVAEVAKLTFSESEKTGIFTSKDAGIVADFVASLSEVQAKKFFEIMGSAKAGLVKLTEELGSGKAAGSVKATDLDTRTTELMSEKKINRSTAMKIAMRELNVDTSVNTEKSTEVK